MNYLRTAKMKFGSNFDSSFTSTIIYTPSEKSIESIQEPNAVITMTRRAIEPLSPKQLQLREQSTQPESQHNVPGADIDDRFAIPDVLEIVLKPQVQEDTLQTQIQTNALNSETQKDLHMPEISRGSTVPGILEVNFRPRILDPTSARENVPKQKTDMEFHGDMVLSQWDRLLALLSGSAGEFAIDGESLDLATIIAVSKYGAQAELSGKVSHRVEQSAEFLKSCLADGQCIYGVNTGFGGSADTRTDEVDKLQRTLISFLNCGVLTSSTPTTGHTKANSYANGVHKRSHVDLLSSSVLPSEDPMASTAMPEPWVRASLLVRSNSLAGGNSGVRLELVRSLVEFLRNDIIPVIPIRGSISASGDLIPLSYIGGALEGSPGIQVWVREKETGIRQLLTADAALSRASLAPLRLGPKEGLAIVNGTAVSAGVGALALHDAHCLAILSQILTAMSVEALKGSTESFDPFLAKIRPHVGQIEASRNIRGFLKGSKLVCTSDHNLPDDGSLRQDRYSTRTTPQWLGPQLESLMLAHKQLTVEVNSTTDNPIIDAEGKRVLHGGNFQAMAVTSAMEKARSVLQLIGRMLFAQCTELINPALNNGLPPNLTADEPSQSFLLKGVDICVAALQAELGFLANPVGPHVQNAEMGNQSLNSLALLSARYTHMALDVLSQLSAAYLLTLCQALDLRARHILFLRMLKPQFEAITREILGPALEDLDHLLVKLWLHFERELSRTTNMDSSERFVHVTASLQTTILSHALSSSKDDANLLSAMRQWNKDCSALVLESFDTNRDNYACDPNPYEFLGPASIRMYKFVRGHLGVSFQTIRSKASNPEAASTPGSYTSTIGSLVTTIYTAIRNGSLYVPMMECLREVSTECHST